MDVYKTEPRIKASAGLQVFAPTPQTSPKPAQESVSKTDESLPSDSQDSNPTKSPSSPFVIVQRHGSRRSAQASESPNLQLSAIQLEPDGDEANSWFPVVALFSFLPSWLVSMIFHLSILVALAVVTLTADQTDRQVVLEISESAERFDEMVEVVILDEMIEDIPEETVDELDDAPVTDVESFVFSEMIQDFQESDRFFEDSDVPGGAALNQPKGKDGGEKGPKKKAKFFGVESEGNRFVFVIDCSGSMATEFRWTQAVEELRKSIDELEYSQEFVIYLYNHTTWAMLGENPSKVDYLTAIEENKVRVFAWLGRASPFGNTLPAFSMKLAVEHQPDAIFMLSDGEIQDRTVAWLRVWNKGEDSDGVPIHTVFLGRGAGRMLMSTIATENNGTFKWIR